MIQGQFFCGIPLVAILTAVIVAEIDVLAREAHMGPVTRFYKTLQADDAGKFKDSRNAAYEDLMMLNNLNLALEPKDNGLLPANDL